MKTSEIISLDLREEGNEEIIQKVLRKIKPFDRCNKEKVSFELLEKFVSKVCRKYLVCTQYIMISRFNEYDYYTMSLRNDETGSWMCSIYGLTIYEIFAKASIFLYSKVKSDEIAER